MVDFVMGEGGCAQVRCEPFPGRGRGFWGEEILEEGGVYGHWGVGPWECWEPGNLAGSHVLFGHPDILKGGFGQEFRPIQSLGSVDCFELSKLQYLS